MASYTYGKTFKKDGKLVCYRYTDKDPKTKKLVSHSAKSSKKKTTSSNKTPVPYKIVRK